MDLPSLLQASGGSITLHIRVRPFAPTTAWAGTLDDNTHVVQVHAAPERNKANIALVRFLAQEAGVDVRHVAIVAGATSPKKVVKISIPQARPRS